MLIPLSLCIGFMIAVLYMDMVFDVSALPYRKTHANLPEHVLGPIVTYYKYITKNPYLLIFVMLTTATCLISQVVYDLKPKRVAYSSLVLFILLMSITILKVIPTAQRLATGKDSKEKQTRMVHSIFPYHVTFLIVVIFLAVLQYSTIGF
jgi:hypothetical protein